MNTDTEIHLKCKIKLKNISNKKELLDIIRKIQIDILNVDKYLEDVNIVLQGYNIKNNN